MRKKISIFRSYNNRMSLKNKDIILKENLDKINYMPKKKETENILFNHKCSLEVLLDMIKNFQKDYISKVNEANKNKINISKKIITLFRENLALMETEKIKKFNYIKEKNENNKKQIQKILFLSETKNIEMNNNVQFKDDLNSFSYIQKKNELNLINFQIENEINKTDFVIEQKNQIYLCAQTIPIYLDKNREIFCNINYENIEKISNILNSITKNVREKFISTVKEKTKTDLEINAIKFELESIKDNLSFDELKGEKNYIDSDDIIYEESKENNKTIITNKSKRNSRVSLNKTNIHQKPSKIPSLKNNVEKRFSIDSLMKDINYPNNILSLFHKNNENKNQINNYLNMNINVNVNINNHGIHKFNYSTSSLSEKNDNKSKDYEDQFEINLDENNKIIVSPIPTEENINVDKNLSIHKNIENDN